ncbi:hypothetical protein EXU48_15410 [Occultella glacieicola]|uniref:Activator of Hsp90 ATPase homologue 1/2-like C-terminal domain-containing protein n=1 Tax=Occultella glacieicola TaxID=2518684 RepID=A0ABY2E2V5_9MICO|nr:SRPBCC domain-containing protein [Occultella glacieicola]TDE91534.1 hypothetical protein EXU48_15410 [Occultella glacieicola]
MENTQNPPAVIDADAFSVRRTIRINAPREKVWRTVTEPDLVSQWFGELVLTGTGVGAHGTIGWPDQPDVPIRVDTFEPPSMVSYRWCNEEGPPLDAVDEERSTVFTFTLEETPDGTLLTVVETGFDNTGDPAVNMASHRDGWDGELDKLVALLERGS